MSTMFAGNQEAGLGTSSLYDLPLSFKIMVGKQFERLCGREATLIGNPIEPINKRSNGPGPAQLTFGHNDKPASDTVLS